MSASSKAIHLTFLILSVSGSVSAHPLTDSIADNLCMIFQAIILMTGVIAVLMITIAGMRWIGSEDDPAARQKSKEQVESIIVGLIIAAASIGTAAVVTGQTPCVWPI
ncbi:MAG: hypothetical protein V1921_00800 [Candidatus Altiarchaeota archaeon]